MVKGGGAKGGAGGLVLADCNATDPAQVQKKREKKHPRLVVLRSRLHANDRVTDVSYANERGRVFGAGRVDGDLRTPVDDRSHAATLCGPAADLYI